MGSPRFFPTSAVLVSSSLVLLAGCSANFAPNPLPVQAKIGSLKGNVYGGQQPIAQAHVYLYAAGTGAPGASSVSLLQNFPGSTISDGTNYYVTTSNSGSFAIGGDYDCTAGTQLYLYVVGGNSGSGTNSAIGMLAALGQCPASGGSLASTLPTVTVNELTTVAAAYALAGFATDATHIASSGSALGTTGIANALAEAGQLVDVTKGSLYTTTPSSTAYTTITVPTQLINSVANILAACINTNSPSSLQCDTLLNNATNGTIQPTDTATAAINMARFPTHAVSTLFTNQPAIGAPYQTALSQAPANFALALQFADQTLTADYPNEIAIDAAGNAWITTIFPGASSSAGVLTEFSPTGVALTGPNGFSSSALTDCDGIAIDNSGNVWIGANGLVELTGSGASIAVSHTYPLGVGGYVAIDPSGSVWYTGTGTISKVTTTGAASMYTVPSISGYAIAIDPSGDLWIPDYNTSAVTELSNSVTLLNGSPITNAALGSPEGVAIDHAGTVWIPGDMDNDFVTFSGTNAAATTYTPTGLSQPTKVAIDGDGNAFIVSTQNSIITEVSGSTPTTVLSGTGFSTGQTAPYGEAIDSSGNLWVLNGQSMTEFIGIAAPVATPTAYAVTNNLLGVRP